MTPLQASDVVRSVDPATGETVWEGPAATAADVNPAVAAARAAAEDWAARPLADRVRFAETFAARLKARRTDLALAISREVGKPRWEALTEVDAMIAKVPLSVAAIHDRRKPTEATAAGVRSATRYKPHGVVAVLGPFNFPGHLPNGHLVPALLAGNAAVFKPSELAPLVAELTLACWRDAGLPDGVLTVVHGGGDVGRHLAEHPGIDGVFFTGSSTVGRDLLRSLADHPQKILALEMGGNNPLLVFDVADVPAAVYHTVQSAYVTAGQRCTCARRLIVPIGLDGDAFVDALVACTASLRIGPHTLDPEPFAGPVVTDAAADRVLAAQEQLLTAGGVPLLPVRSIGPRRAMLSPGLIDVTAVSNRGDAEVFGPLLRLVRVPDFDAGIAEANRTAYGLAAGLLSDSSDLYEQFFRRVRAGVVNWNRPTTGASGSLPFGGIGASGNHRPSGSWAADYCSFPVASLESDRLELPPTRTPGVPL